MVQGLNQDYDPQGGPQEIQDWSLYFIQSKNLVTIIVIIYVDDMLTIGDQPALMDAIEPINK